MTSQTLREARAYEEVAQQRIAPEEKPAFHLAPRTGWMNDPNGFSWYDGQYHLFYQYHPYDSQWANMHWGHAVSRDLLHWQDLPAALAPDKPYDHLGVWSGSGITLPDGRHMLMYTGFTDKQRPDGSMAQIQVQCLAMGDGLDYEKYEGNPVLDERDLPQGGNPRHFRDPKIWRRPDGSYRCVMGNLRMDGNGTVVLYGSPDGLKWSFIRVLAENGDRLGKMWECPDFFELDGTHVLITSYQRMLAQGHEYNNGYGVLALLGDFDESTEAFTERLNQRVDHGIDFYAPQTTLAPDGRRIMIGWMQNWDTSKFHGDECKWFGQMNIPRELSVQNGRLIQQPIRELEALRVDPVVHQGVTVEGETRLPGVQGRMADIELTVKPAEPFRAFTLALAEDERFRTTLRYTPEEGLLTFDRKYGGYRRAFLHQCSCPVRTGAEGELKLRLILDRYSAEVFVNDGEQVMSITLETPLEAEGISFGCDGKAHMDLVKYELKA